MRYGMIVALIGLVVAIGYGTSSNVYDEVRSKTTPEVLPSPKPQDAAAMVESEPFNASPKPQMSVLPAAESTLAKSADVLPKSPTKGDELGAKGNVPKSIPKQTKVKDKPKVKSHANLVSFAKKKVNPTLIATSKPKDLLRTSQSPSIQKAAPVPAPSAKATQAASVNPKHKEAWRARLIKGRPLAALDLTVTPAPTCKQGGYCARDRDNRDVLLVGVIVTLAKASGPIGHPMAFQGELRQGNYLDVTPAVYLR